ncbi:hypothetical protein LCGC14_0560810, partial [marine sediment metagenome]
MAFPGSVALRGGDQYRTTSDQIYPLGTRAYTNDGRVFRYTKNGGTALTVGSLIQAEAPGGYSDDQLLVTGEAVTSGSTSVLIKFSTGSTVASPVDEFKEGYLFVNDGTGEGQMVQIRTHEVATTAGAGGNSTVQFMDYGEFTAVVSTGDTAAELGLIKNPYDDVIEFPATMTGIPVGITPRGVAANQHFWLQTWGIAPCKVKSSGTGVPAVGFPLMPATVAGDVSRPFWNASTKFTSAGAFNGARATFMA